MGYIRQWIRVLGRLTVYMLVAGVLYYVIHANLLIAIIAGMVVSYGADYLVYRGEDR